MNHVPNVVHLPDLVHFSISQMVHFTRSGPFEYKPLNWRSCPFPGLVHWRSGPQARSATIVAELQSTSEKDWSVSQNKLFRASFIVWGMPKSLSTLEIRAKLADIGLASFARGSVAWEGDHVRLLLLPN